MNLFPLFLATTSRILQRIPEQGVTITAHALARLFSILLVKRRSVMMANLHTVFDNELSPPQKNNIIFQSWLNLIYTGFETLRFPLYGQQYLAQLKTHNFEAIQASMQKGKGMILLAPHTGNFFLGASFLAQHFPVSVLIRPSRNKPFQDLLQRSFDSMGFETIDRVGGMRQAVQALRNHRMLVIAFDQHAGGHGIWIPFFGRPASSFSTPASLALKYDLPVHVGYLHRHPDGSNEAWGTEAFSLIRTGDLQNDILQNTLLFSRKFEDIIRQYPQTWMWMHKRWKEKPTD